MQEVKMEYVVLKNEQVDVIRSVKLLGHDGPIKWEANGDGLRVWFPEDKPCEYAHCLKIEIN